MNQDRETYPAIMAPSEIYTLAAYHLASSNLLFFFLTAFDCLTFQQILRKLKHENIIEMLDAFENPQEFCVVTEFAQVLILY